MKKVVITQSNYIPWKGFFDSVNLADEFVFYDDMQFTRRDWRNRNQIKTKDGVKWLTVPVEVKGKYFQKIKDTTISDPGWAKNHWDTITHNYSKAEYFKEYKDFFQELYMGKEYVLISDVNTTFTKAICKLLGIETKIRQSDEFELLEEKSERLVDICKKLNATDYYSGPAAKAYMDESKFENENIKIHYFDYSGYPEYRQLHGEFTHAVSIIDLIFNEGPDAKNFMKTFNKSEK
ncbi:MAG TPA: WbqC family protein [Ignavibacteria bacterium]|nr:WbqC family protein [Ignavibacteria bacterium]HQY51116.1 WbqC family protein [Ignavibacteria bacterium]HRA98968.1 WbqC family protein [Ignavibacteria bacterium]